MIRLFLFFLPLKFRFNITYDRNGNIWTLQRTAAGNPVDDLIYGYRGNQLVSLSEQVRTSQAGDVYLPGNTASGMYEYDSNGNLTKDSRKGLEYKYCECPHFVLY